MKRSELVKASGRVMRVKVSFQARVADQTWPSELVQRVMRRLAARPERQEWARLRTNSMLGTAKVTGAGGYAFGYDSRTQSKG